MLHYVENPSLDAAYNLALEEYLLTRKEQEFFLLWQDRCAIVVGRNQNTEEQINRQFVQQRGVQVVRRLTGGGAVYHDLGNLNFTFIVNSAEAEFAFARFARPLVQYLQSLGVPAGLAGRNDVVIQGKKISGNAACHHRGRLLHHGTIMFDVNLDDLVQSLQVDPEKISSKGVDSVRSRVTNIRPYLPPGMTLEQFREGLRAQVEKEYGGLAVYRLEPVELAAVEKLAREKYASPAWVYGQSPVYNVRKTHRFPWGQLDLRLQVEDGVIKQARLFGDFFARQDIAPLEEWLAGCPYDRAALAAALDETWLRTFLPELGREELLDVLFTG